MFEEQKAAIDSRYRQLLEESIQDAVYLSSRNSDISQENQLLKQRMLFLPYCHFFFQVKFPISEIMLQRNIILDLE